MHRNRRRGEQLRCFECGDPNHFRSSCPKLNKSSNEDNKHSSYNGKKNNQSYK
ncbi:hypothetical protein BS78_04G126000 [Paspalum vaginatum]|nr:hypothetical protein BS78_04G126000 [Paspalum vaginatum]